MRLTTDKLLKDFDRNDDGHHQESWLDSMHSMGVVPHDLDLLFAHDRATKFTERVRSVFAQQNWVALGEAPSQKLMRTIRDNKPSPRKYALMMVDETILDTSYIHDFIKHYQRGDDYIQFYSCGANLPIVITSNAKEWMCVIAPRILERSEDTADFETLYSPPAIISDAPTLTTTTPKTFNPLTGVFE